LQPADVDIEEELLAEEAVGDVEELGEEEAAAAESKLLLESPEGSITHAELGLLGLFLSGAWVDSGRFNFLGCTFICVLTLCE